MGMVQVIATSSDGALDDLQIQLCEMLIERRRASSNASTHESSIPSEADGALPQNRSPANNGRTRQLSFSTQSGRPCYQIWRQIASLSLTTFPRFYNQLVWSNGGLGVADEEELVSNSLRWRFNGNPLASHDMMKAVQESITEQLGENRGIKPAKLLFSFPREDQEHFVEVYLNTYKSFKAAKDTVVRWENHPLELARSSIATSTKQRIIRIHQVNPSRAEDFWYKVRKDLNDVVEFHHLWARRKEHEWTDGKKPAMNQRPKKASEHHVTLIGLVMFKGNNRDRQLPGYIKDEYNKEFVLDFEGRGNRCTFCRSNAREAHTLEECWSKKCSRCKRKGHLMKDCRAPSMPQAKFRW
ncbi:uncharacterized protein SPSC_03153 [Sporisorium scitamineum]|uniref:CCHC-type domain-containing protein n=1 Tax=Sporisorium scitamineum TaxID=49012 RepID=A0A127Z6K7_9BASI|nr:uncharacterized protein SPSC_03153 [Sporisorium scitamineum]